MFGFIAKIKEAWLHCVTGPDNKTHDVVRWVAALGSLHALFLCGWDVVGLHNHFDIQNYGVGFGAMLTGVGAALGLKKDTEPRP
jgi:hypothetical protein